jgi:hypothetical protein
MNTNQWRNEVLRKKTGHTTKKINRANASAGVVYASPNTARLYLTLSDQEVTPNKLIQPTTKASAD